MAIGIGLGLAGLFGLIGSGISASGAQAAAGEQANAQQAALGLQQNEFNTITGLEKPYNQAGIGALNQLQDLLGTGSNTGNNAGGSFGSLLQPFTAQYMQQYSPAYQFQRAQGEYGTLAGNSSGQGALSGAAQQGLESYNQEFANTAFNNAFQQYNTQQNNIYQRLAGLVNTGQNAASLTGAQGANMVNSMGQTLSNIGTAQAGGTVGAANAISGGLSNLGNLGTIYALMGAGGGTPRIPEY